MGEVWRATDLELNREVAIKVPRSGDARREARIGAGLSHPNVVTVFDVIVEDGNRWLVMEYFPSRSLARILNEDGVQPPKQVAVVGAQIADALATMHEKGMVHKDITPANILVSADHKAKLIDLGIASWSNVTQTGADQVAGTPDFMAQEVHTGGQQATAASDVYSLGATLSAAVGAPSGRLKPVLDSFLQAEPSKRPSAAKARRMLTEVTGRRRRIPLPVAAAAGAIVLLAAGIWLFRPSAHPVAPPATAAPATTTSSSAPVSLMGDLRTANPCGVLDPSAVSRFGEPEMDSDYGGFNRCDVLVHLSSGDDPAVDIRAEFQNADPSAPRPTKVSQQSPPLSEGACARELTLPDGYRITIAAKHLNDRPADLCAMADAETNAALLVLQQGPIPRRARPIPAESVANLNSCDLLTGDEVKTVVVAPAQPGFANWQCDWDNGAGPLSLRVIYDRNQPLDSRDGKLSKVGGRKVYTQPDDPNGCIAKIVYRSYPDPDPSGGDNVELVNVVVRGEKPEQQLCASATALAGAVVAKLPK